MQKPSQKQTGAQKSIPTSQKQQLDTIQLSSDDEQADATTASKATSNIFAPISCSSSNAAAHEQRNRSRTRSRSRSQSHGSSSSSLSSTLSSSYRSLDYEAEADEEDANECEGIELQRKLAGGNDNLMHVQNFLNCFDTPQQERKQKATTQPGQQQQILLVGKPLSPRNEINRSELSDCIEFAKHHQYDATGIITAAAEANTTEEIPTTSSAVATKASNKPCKFTISTKFLRKPRHKLKSVNIAPAADVSNALAATTSECSEEMGELQESREGQQQQKSEPISQQQRQQRQATQVDEPNVKFNSNFSINSLLNKR